MSERDEAAYLYNVTTKHFELVRRRLLCTSARVHTLFCLACAERLLPTVYVYSLVTHEDVSVFFLWTQSLFTLLVEDEAIPVVPLTLLRQVRRAVPHEDKHETPWTGPSHLAVWCLWCAIQALHDSDLLYPEWASESGLYAAIQVAKTTWEQLGRVGPEPAYGNAFVRELQKQRADLGFLTTAANRTPQSLQKWRADNRGFAVPVTPPTL